MDFLIDPMGLVLSADGKNTGCTINKEQCGCNVVELCACPLPSLG